MKTLEKIRAELLNAHKDICGAVEIGECDCKIFNYNGVCVIVNSNHLEVDSGDCSLEVWNFSTGRTKIGICGDIKEALKLAKVMKDWEKMIYKIPVDRQKTNWINIYFEEDNMRML